MIDAKTIGEKLAEARMNNDYTDVDLMALDGWGDADAIRKAADAAYGDKKVGYKAGATNPAGWSALGIDGSFRGVLFARDAHSDGAVLSWSNHFRGVEAEFAFKMGQDFDPSTGSAEELINAIESCHAALEIVGRRTRGNGLPKFPAVVADFAGHCAFVLGPTIANWRSFDLAAIEVKGLVDGVEKASGSGANVLGHPLKSVAWLASAIAQDGDRLEAGDIVLSGTTLGIVPPTPGATIVGDFGPCGKINVTFRRS